MTDRDRNRWNTARWTAGDPRGHYESWFQRANHPSRPLAFWIRYTIFSPKGRPTDALGELWAIAFDGERRKIVAVKEEHSIRSCTFSKSELAASVGGATLGADALSGTAAANGHTIEWDLRYTSPAPPLLLLDERLYAAPLPKAKALVGSPLAVFDGTLRIDGETWPIGAWVGSQNHNWGEKHTDKYAWGQVAGFDDAPDSFLEVATAQVKLGPLMTPPMTVMVLRHGGREHAFNTIPKALLARGSYDYFRWTFECGDKTTRISGTMSAAASDFIGLPYYNPPGGTQTCLNCKIARCDVTIRTKGEPVVTLGTRHRAAFEILTKETDHGIPVMQWS